MATKKRSLTVAGHRTSISLEDEFWHAAKQIAAERSVSLAQLIARIDEQRSDPNLSSAIRIHVLQHFQQNAARR